VGYEGSLIPVRDSGPGIYFVGQTEALCSVAPNTAMDKTGAENIYHYEAP
jgi:hypothetical protein